MKITALILAGGRGERFWPKSRQDLPKQFLCLTDENRTMLQCTVDRILPLVAMEDIFVVTNQDYREIIRRQLPNLPEENILCEPVGKNTAPCIGLGAVHMRKKYGDAIMLVLPSDHLITQQQLFRKVLLEGIRVTDETSAIVTLGIPPSSPDTGYGYIQYDPDEAAAHGQAFRVKHFVEKPSRELAEQYVASDDYLWNSGIFIWKASTLLQQMKNHLPDNYALLESIEAAIGTREQDLILARQFLQMQSISIDYGVMEHARDVYTLAASFGWDDVGSWLSMARISQASEQGNVIKGNAIAVDSSNCIVHSEGRMIAMVGLENLIVVDTQDVLLLCGKPHAGSIQKVLAELRALNRTELL